MTFRSIARAVWHDDVQLAKVLLDSSKSAKYHLVISDGHVQLKFPSLFNKHFCENAAAQLQADRDH
eukprot:343768-Alexandrium_andersonii.AAC.1